ncbi:hypothetical protein Tco_1501609 [Tanacetum coccineum]
MRLLQITPPLKPWGFCQLKGKMDNSRALVHDGRVLKVISSILIGQDKSTDVSITDYHVGNPCEKECDPRVENYSPMIDSLYGCDCEERGMQAKA